MLLKAARSQLLIIDMQERFIPAMHDAARAVERCIRLVEAARLMDIPVSYSEQYPKGLGPTVPALKERLGNAPRYEKMHFSCARDEALAARIESLAEDGRDQLVIAGIEAHVCVLQTATDFGERGLFPFVAADAVTSRAPESVDLALRRLEAGAAEIINSEMTLFEWMEVAGTPTFKAVSPLVK